MKKLLLVLSLLVCRQIALGQSYSYLSYSTSEGLPQSQVTSITQDKSGYLWVGTLSGLASFNGRKFNSFSTENGLVNNRITCLKILNDKLWIGHEGGISCMVNGKAKGWQLYAEDRNVSVSQIIDFKGTIIIATNGSGLYFLNNNKLTRYRFPDDDANRCRDLLVTDGKVIVGTRSGIYTSSDLKKFTHNNVLGTRSISGFAVKDNRLVISTFSQGLFTSDLKLNKTDSVPISKPNFNIKKCLIDNWGQVWLSSIFGVLRINQHGGQLLLDQLNGLPTSSVNCVFEDREGNIWFGTEGKGLLRFTGEQFAYYNKRNGFPTDLILSIAKSRNGVYYYGSYDYGVFNWFSPEIIHQVPMPASTAWCMEFDSYGNLWCGTNLVGLTKVRPSGEIETLTINGQESRITVIKKIKGSRLIAGGPDGIGWIKNEAFYPIDLSKGDDIGTARDFIFHNQQLYCGSDKGLFEINTYRNKAKLLRRFKTAITSLTVDVTNRLWIGTENGLFIFDGVKYTAVFTGNTSNSRFINFLQKIDGEIYAGTNNGLYVFNSEDDKPLQLRRYGVHDGLINLESNVNSAFYDGRYLWFGTAEGLIRFEVKSEGRSRIITSNPIVNINEILLNYEAFDFQKYSTSLNENGFPQNLKLPYNKNNISIDLDGILLSDPNGLKYQFWLEGMDDTWSPLLSNSSIVLSNLPSGNYKLHMRTMNQNGFFSDELLLPITITPPFWGTWWFYLIIIVLLTLAIRSFFRSRIKKERDRNYKENLENKTRLLALEQQSLNASMNRHFIFNSLNSIQYFINTQDRLSANRYLTSFAKLIRKNLDSAAEGDNIVSLQQEMERLELYLSLEAMRFKDRFDYEFDTEDIDTESIPVPAMLLQPFVENSIIHGILPNEEKKGLIRIQLRKSGNNIEILLADNGVGIDFSLKQKKSFDGDHKSQGMEITSKRIDLIRKMWKKDYELYGPYQVQHSDGSIKGTHVLIKIPYENLDY